VNKIHPFFFKLSLFQYSTFLTLTSIKYLNKMYLVHSHVWWIFYIIDTCFVEKFFSQIIQQKLFPSLSLIGFPLLFCTFYFFKFFLWISISSDLMWEIIIYYGCKKIPSVREKVCSTCRLKYKYERTLEAGLYGCSFDLLVILMLWRIWIYFWEPHQPLYN